MAELNMFVRERSHSTGASLATYLVGARGPEYRRDDVSGAIRWYLYDGLGCVLGEVDPTGAITSSRKYDVYGAVRGGVNPAGSSKHKFVGALGHPSEDETGLTYMQARYYDPAVGRFVSQDPAKHGGNWYQYASGSPINRIDPDGKDDLWNWQFQTLRTEWRYALSVSPQFRLVAAGFLSLWWGMFIVDALGGSPGAEVNSIFALNALTSDAAGRSGAEPLVRQELGVVGGLEEEIRGFYAGWAAGEQLTMMFLFPEDWM